MEFKLSLLGDRVLVKLDRVPDYVTESGLTIPKYENITTEGGRPAVKRSSATHAAAGTIIALSPKAHEALLKDPASPKVPEGKRVLVTPSTAFSEHYSFYPVRNSTTLPASDIICIPHNLIEAFINE